MKREGAAARRELRAQPPAAAHVRPGTTAWASAVGNRAVQRLARQAAELDESAVEEAGAAPEAASEPDGQGTPEAAAPPEAAAMEQAGIGPEAVAGLDAVEQMEEGALSD